MREQEKYKIWYREFDENRNPISVGVYHKEYITYGQACRVARMKYGDSTRFEYRISILNPWETHYSYQTCDICSKRYMVPKTCMNRPLDMCIYLSVPRENLIHPGENHNKRYRACPDCIMSVREHIQSLKGETK